MFFKAQLPRGQQPYSKLHSTPEWVLVDYKIKIKIKTKMESASHNSDLIELWTATEHDGTAWCVAWSPRGDMLASCGSDKTLRIWAAPPSGGDDFSTWTCIAALEGDQTRTVRSCRWSPCGAFIAATSFDSTTLIWERQSDDGGMAVDDEEEAFQCVAVLEGHENEVKDVAWSTSGELLATCSRDKKIWLWEAGADEEGVEFECICILSGHSQDVKCVRWHPHRPWLLSASYDDTVKLWVEESEGTDEWLCALTLTAHKATVWQLAFEGGLYGTHLDDASAAASRPGLATCSDDCSVVIWNDATDGSGSGGSPQLSAAQHFENLHERTIFSVDWAREIATGGADDAICILARPVAGADFEVALRRPKAHDGDVNCVSWHPTRPDILASCGDDGAVKVWRVQL